MSAAPIYKQMERLEDIKVSQDSELQALRSTGRTRLDRLVDLSKFEEFSSHYRKLLTKGIEPNELRQMINATDD